MSVIHVGQSADEFDLDIRLVDAGPVASGYATSTDDGCGSGNTGSSAMASSDPGPAQSKTLRMRGNSLHGNREILPAPAGDGPAGRLGKAFGRTPDMYASRKSDGCVVCAGQRPDQDG